MIKRNKQHRRRGVALVEMALVLPIFMLVLMGIVEFGRAMIVSQMITTAARDAGRLAIMGGSSSADVKKSVKDFLNETLGVAKGDVTVNIRINGSKGGNIANAEQGDLCSLEVKVPFDKVSLIKGDYLNGKSLSGSCVM